MAMRLTHDQVDGWTTVSVRAPSRDAAVRAATREMRRDGHRIADVAAVTRHAGSNGHTWRVDMRVQTRT